MVRKRRVEMGGDESSPRIAGTPKEDSDVYNITIPKKYRKTLEEFSKANPENFDFNSKGELVKSSFFRHALDKLEERKFDPTKETLDSYRIYGVRAVHKNFLECDFSTHILESEILLIYTDNLSHFLEKPENLSLITGRLKLKLLTRIIVPGVRTGATTYQLSEANLRILINFYSNFEYDYLVSYFEDYRNPKQPPKERAKNLYMSSMLRNFDILVSYEMMAPFSFNVLVTNNVAFVNLYSDPATPMLTLEYGEATLPQSYFGSGYVPFKGKKQEVQIISPTQSLHDHYLHAISRLATDNSMSTMELTWRRYREQRLGMVVEDGPHHTNPNSKKS